MSLAETISPRLRVRPSQVPEGVIAGRYTLGDRIGAGGMGEVWAASDALSGREVAIKIMLRKGAVDDPRFRREVRALRVLDVPGVVKLLDEGVYNERAFIVMERVCGDPFPGVPGALEWRFVRPLARQLLGTMDRVHAAGLLHRDLKPGNVLVDRAQRVRVLDFGLTAGSAVGSRMTVEGALLGTPAYMAPELVRGERASVRTDLYAIGSMLFEALAGRLPFEGGAQRAMMARTRHPAPPLASVAPHTPREVAEWVDLLLSAEPEKRPSSARQALALMDGQTHTLEGMPLLGRDRVLQDTLSALEAGRIVEVLGAPGSGRSRLLSAVRTEWEQAGGRTEVLSAGRRAFESLGALAAPIRGRADMSMAEAEAWLHARLSGLQKHGVVILVDDEPKLDRHSRRLIESLPPGPRLLCVDVAAPGSVTVTLRALTADDIRPIILGPERLFHIPTDATALLMERSDGNCRRLAAEVDAWVEQGLARWDRGRLSIDRGGLDRLLSAPPNRPAGHGLQDLEPEQAAMIAAMSSAWSSVDEQSLAEALGRPLWEVQADLDELESRQMVRRIGGRLECVTSGTPAPVGDETALHRRLAAQLASADPGRLFHLAMAGDVHGLATATERQARSAIAKGQFGRARGILSAAVKVARESGDRRCEAQLLRVWTESALLEETGAALDEVVYELCRASDKDSVTQHLALARATLAALINHSPDAVAQIDAIGAFEDATWELRRHQVRVRAARRLPIDQQSALVEQSARWATALGTPDATRACETWLGRLRYRQGRSAEAARHHQRAAAVGTPIEQISSRLSAASCFIEAFDLEQAQGLARQAGLQAREIRSAYHEGRAALLERMAAYRLELDVDDDPALLEAATRLGRPTFEALLRLTCAAFAWRRGDVGRAIELAAHAERLWRDASYSDPADMALALGAAAGATVSPAAVDAAIERALACPYAGHGMQVGGLLSAAGVEDTRLVELVTLDRARIDADAWKLRQEVISGTEAEIYVRL